MGRADPIYLDNNATAPPLAQVVEAVADTMHLRLGNPSSPHGCGAEGRRYLALPRDKVAVFLGAEPSQVFFTSGGTEGNNTVLAGGVRINRIARIVTTGVEHDSVLRPAEALAGDGTEVVYVPVEGDGRVKFGTLEAALADEASVLLSVQWANSDTGVVQPIAEIASLARSSGCLLHVDAAQAVGRLPIDLATIPIDYLTFSGHKVHGPLGTGVLYVRDPRSLWPLLHGGAQEGGLRAGTENVPGIVGLALACELRGKDLTSAIARMQALRDQFERRLLSDTPGLTVNGARASRVCNTSNIQFSGVDGQALLAHLDREGISCSQTSACSSNRPQPSHVLLAMNLSEEEAYSSLRFSFSVLNTEDEVERVAYAVRDAVPRLRGFMPT